jgi:hypothetical protein
MTRISLPPSLDASKYTISKEVAFARSLTPEQRLVILARVCRASRKILELNTKRDWVMKQEDPLPASTIAAIKRLHTD